MPATITRTNTECVAEDFTVTGQSIHYVNIVTSGVTLGTAGGTVRERFRVVIHRDSHTFQSYARVEVWRRDGWTLVHALPGEDVRVDDLPTKYAAAHDTSGAREQFGDLSSDLLELATRVVA